MQKCCYHFHIEVSDKNINIHVIIEISLLNSEMTIKTLFRITLNCILTLGSSRPTQRQRKLFMQISQCHMKALCTNNTFTISIFLKGEKKYCIQMANFEQATNSMFYWTAFFVVVVSNDTFNQKLLKSYTTKIL